MKLHYPILVSLTLLSTTAPAGLFNVCKHVTEHGTKTACPTGASCASGSATCVEATWERGYCASGYSSCAEIPSSTSGGVPVYTTTKACSITWGGNCTCEGGEEVGHGYYLGDVEDCE